jgi:hypothetical protein
MAAGNAGRISWGGIALRNTRRSALVVIARLATALVAVVLLQAAAPLVSAQSLDYQYYKTRVEPIFLKKRPGHARCVVCHAESTNAFNLQRLPAGSSTWTDEQSRQNFDVVSRLANIATPDSSLLLLHPLAPEAGGDYFHSGGRQFASRNDPDWLVLAEWIRSAKK